MIRRPRLRQHYRLHGSPGDGLYLLSERERLHLDGSVFEYLAPLLDGGHDSEDIVLALADRVAPPEVYYALLELEARGCLIDGTDQTQHTEAGFWHALGIDAAAACSRLAIARVAVVGVGEVDTERFAAMLREHGVTVGDPGDAAVVLTDDYLRDEVAALGQEFLGRGCPWLVAKPVGLLLWLGPLFIPGRTGCWQCLRHRLEANRPLDVQAARGRTATYRPATGPATVDTALGMLTTHVLRWLVTGAENPLAGVLVTFDTIESRLERHAVPRRPQCHACGDAGLYGRRVSQAFALGSVPIAFRGDGGYRAVAPDATLARFSSLVSPLTGIVGAVHRISTDGADHIHVYVAQRAGGTGREPGRAGIREGSSGKGVTAIQAEASAVGEAIERYCGTYQGDEPCIRASFAELGETAIHPNACMLFSDAQYRQTSRGSAQFGRLVPRPFDPSALADWTPVWSLTRGCHRYLPTMYLYYRYPLEIAAASCMADSNGSAAGNTPEEAVLQGLLELVERDGVAMWWYNRASRPALALDDAGPVYCDRLREAYHAGGRELWVLDVTSDLGIPTFAAVSRRRAGAPEEVMLGFGAHLDATIALTRALTEMNQMLMLVRLARAEGRSLGATVDQWLRSVNVAAETYLLPGPQPARRVRDFPAAGYEDVGLAVQRCRQAVEARGLETLVLDQTRPDVAVPVVKVVVPGLRHFWPRFAPGRLFDVPVQLGWLPAPRSEAELNPLALPA